jgi:hypothetical protein
MFPAVFATRKEYEDNLKSEAARLWENGMKFSNQYHEDIFVLKKQLIEQRNQFQTVIKQTIPKILQEECERF